MLHVSIKFGANWSNHVMKWHWPTDQPIKPIVCQPQDVANIEYPLSCISRGVLLLAQESGSRQRGPTDQPIKPIVCQPQDLANIEYPLSCIPRGVLLLARQSGCRKILQLEMLQYVREEQTIYNNTSKVPTAWKHNIQTMFQLPENTWVIDQIKGEVHYFGHQSLLTGLVPCFWNVKTPCQKVAPVLRY